MKDRPESVYLKVSTSRNVGRIQVEKVVRINSKGEFIVVNIGAKTIKVLKSLGGLPVGSVHPIGKSEYEAVYDNVLKALSDMK